MDCWNLFLQTLYIPSICIRHSCLLDYEVVLVAVRVVAEEVEEEAVEEAVDFYFPLSRATRSKCRSTRCYQSGTLEL
jgi:hypothetical protein